MDNLTHSAVGLFLSRAGLNRLTPYATPILILSANLPDLDVVAAAGGSLNYLHFHRHMTHALIAIPLLAFIAVALVRAIVRKPLRWGGAMLAAAIGLASHYVLDWTNVYGVRMLLPFSNDWLRLDITNVFDIWIWSICLLGIAGPFLARLVGGEISSGAGKSKHHGRGFARFALLVILLYDMSRGVIHGRAVAALSSRMYDDAAPVRVTATPDAVNPFRWLGIVETEGAFVVQDLNLAAPDPVATRPVTFHKPDPDPAIDAARRTPAFQQFLAFSQLPLWRVTPWPAIENGRLVEVVDMRFGTPLSPGFMVKAIVDGQGQVVESEFRFGTPRPR